MKLTSLKIWNRPEKPLKQGEIDNLQKQVNKIRRKYDLAKLFYKRKLVLENELTQALEKHKQHKIQKKIDHYVKEMLSYRKDIITNIINAQHLIDITNSDGEEVTVEYLETVDYTALLDIFDNVMDELNNIEPEENNEETH